MRIKYFSYFVLVLLATASCKKGYLDINEVNPNQTQSPPINGLLASVTYQTGLDVFRAGNFTSYYMQYLASPNQGSASDIYEQADRSSLWFTIGGGGVYNTITDARVMVDKAIAANAPHHVGVAKVAEAMGMSMLIDIFGDVPYSKAFDTKNFTPNYDKAEDIYNRCLALLDEAIVEFGKANPTVALDGASDMIHGGNVGRWIKTSYALKARLLNRVSKLSSYNPTQILNALSNAYISNAEDAQVTRFVQRSPWGQLAYNQTVNLLDVWMSEQFINHMNGTIYGVFDPRLKLIASPTSTGAYVGTRNGRGRTSSGTTATESYLWVNGYYGKSDAPLLLVTFAEMKFIEAEATFATDKARSYAAYLAGIAAHMDKLGVAASDKNTYIAHTTVSVGVNNFTRDHIFKEKYVAMFLHPEAWTDARRYDYKYRNFALPFNAALGTAFIRRVNYPTSEISRNGANVPSIGSLADRLWWDRP